jgi:hypothetical protein
VYSNCCGQYSLSLLPQSLSIRSFVLFSQKGAQHGKVSCDWLECEKTFTRKSDLRRHCDTVHRRTEQFWCLVTGCTRSKDFPGQSRPFPRNDKFDSQVRNVHHATGFTAEVFNTRNEALDASITNFDQSASNSGLTSGYWYSSEQSWLYGNTDSAALTETNTPATNGLLPRAGGSVDRQVGFVGFTVEVTGGFTEMTSPVTAIAEFAGTDWFSFVDESASSNGFNTSGFIRAGEMNQLALIDGYISAGWSGLNDTEANNILHPLV